MGKNWCKRIYCGKKKQVFHTNVTSFLRRLLQKKELYDKMSVEL